MHHVDRAATAGELHDLLGQSANVLLALMGAALIIMSSRQMFLSLRSGSSRLRGGRIIKRKNHPVIFWISIGGLIVVCILGCWLILWSMLRA